MVKLEDSPKWLRWIQEISFVKYGFFGAAVTIFRTKSIEMKLIKKLFSLRVVRRRITSEARRAKNRRIRG